MRAEAFQVLRRKPVQVEVEDPDENIGAKLVRQAAAKTNDLAGDGATNSVVLAQGLVYEGVKAVTAGANPVQITWGMEKTAKALVEELPKLSKDAEDSELADVAYPILKISEDIEQEALCTLVINKLAAVKAPGVGERKIQYYLDNTAILTGGSVLRDDAGLSLHKAKKSVLGTDSEVVLNKESTTIVGDGSTQEQVSKRVAQIKNRIEAADHEYEKEKLNERIAKLAGGVAIIQVGERTEAELKNKLRVEDALNAAKPAAVEEGTVVVESYKVHEPPWRRMIPSKVDALKVVQVAEEVYSTPSNYFRDCFRESMRRVDLNLITRTASYRWCLGDVIVQAVPSTCTIAAVATCIEAQHRLKYENINGQGSFKATVDQEELFRVCANHQKYRADLKGLGYVWMPGNGVKSGGAFPDHVVEVAARLGGLLVSGGGGMRLPINGWHYLDWNSPSCPLTKENIARLMDTVGLFVGDIWVSPWYRLFNSPEDNDMVYKSGCARSLAAHNESEARYPGVVGMHSVVCFGYRYLANGDMHVHIIDNHEPAGPTRWVDSEEIEYVTVIHVDAVKNP